MRVADIQRFCMHDGPGVRTTVFFKGCPLDCKWCHNPETKSGSWQLLFYKNKCIGCGICMSCENGVHIFGDGHTLDRDLCSACGRCADECPTKALEISGMEYTPEEIFEEIKRDAAFYGETGGVTLSGGEPLVNWRDAAELLKLCKDHGIGTAIETCGFFDPEILYSIVPLCDLFLWDVKDTDPDRHRAYTGKDNARILDNLRLADSLGAKTRLRCILVCGVNTDNSHYGFVADLFSELSHCEGVELIPYHSYGDAKSEALGVIPTNREDWIPTGEIVRDAKRYFCERGIRVF